jgi:hypothetical protein
MKLIREINEAIQVLTEEKDGKKHLYIEGVYMQAGIPNKNNRRYAEHIMEREVARYMKECVQAKRAYGELGHPQGPQINLDRVSHLIESLKFEGKNVIGRAKILETPMGNIAKGLIEGGANLGVSSRGLGSLKPAKDGIMEVQDDFKLCTAADIVADPSAPDAYVQGIMEEADWLFENGEWVRVFAEKTRDDVKKMTTRELAEAKLRLFGNMLKTLK